MPYVSCLVSCSVVWRCSLQLSLSLGALLDGALLVQGFGLCSLFYLGYFCIVLWDSLAGLCALWDSLSSRCTLGWPTWPMIGYPLLGVHPNISIVRLIMIGYHCNHLDGQLNYQASAHWLISVTMMYQLCNQ